MNKKILIGGIIAVTILVGVSLNSVVGMSTELEKEPCLDVGRVFMKGIMLNSRYFPNINHNIWIHLVVWYKNSSGVHREVYWFEPFHNFRDSAYMGRMYEVGFGIFIHVFGLYMGGLEIE